MWDAGSFNVAVRRLEPFSFAQRTDFEPPELAAALFKEDAACCPPSEFYAGAALSPWPTLPVGAAANANRGRIREMRTTITRNH